MLKKKLFISLIFALTLLMLGTVTSLSIAVDPSSIPIISDVTPIEGSVAYVANQTISFTVTDPDLISDTGYFIKLNGLATTTTFTYSGHEVIDSCGGSSWVIDYNKATISAEVVLNEGPQTVEVNALDKLGNPVTKTWTFNANIKPVFSDLAPAAGGTTNNNKIILARVTDDNQVDPAYITFSIDNHPYQHSFDPTTGIVSVNTPIPLTDGYHTAFISASDLSGNIGTISWGFTVVATGPEITFLDDGKTLVNPSPLITVGLKSIIQLVGSPTITVDGIPVPSTFTYKGHEVIDSCGGSSYVIDSYNEGNLSCQLTSLTEGLHTIAVTASDIFGNTSTQQFSFIIDDIPIFSEISPPKGAETVNNTGFSVKVFDLGGINPSSIIMFFDYLPVSASYDPVTGLISYQPTTVIADGIHNVDIRVVDMTGNTSTINWSYTVRVHGPIITFGDAGKTFNSYKPSIVVQLKSNVRLNDTGNVMLIDQTPVNATFVFKGHTVVDSCGGTSYKVDSYNDGTLTYNVPTLSDGNHNLTITAKDYLGNVSSNNFVFSIDQPPLITDLTPSNDSEASTKTITISAKAYDPNGPAIDQTSVKLLVNGNQVTPVVTENNGIVTITNEVTLADESTHNLSLAVASLSGSTANANWKFSIKTKGDMPITAQNCGVCHTLNSNIKYTHSRGPAGCAHCHNGYDSNYCAYCHEPTALPAKSCVDCHLSNALIHHGVTGLLPLHNINKTDCNNCHSIYLTREHNRVNKLGVQLNCNTCHQSTNTTVKQAIINRNKDCSACHQNIDHITVHTYQLDSSCISSSCHSNILSTGHIDNPTTKDKGYNCETCHAASTKEVKRSIIAKKLDCAGCHSKGHNIGFADSVPSDIPLYLGFEWSSPQEASNFIGELNTPAGFEKGQLIISGRKADVTLNQLWEFYTSQLTVNKWTLKSTAPAADAVSFEALFEKDGRSLIVKCFNTLNSNGSGIVLSDGYKTELWYK